jgi:hypothetical protein
MPTSKREELLKAARNMAIDMLKNCEAAEENNLSVEELETRLNKILKSLPVGLKGK